MKLFRFNKAGQKGLGMVDSHGKSIDISDAAMDLNEDFFGQDGLKKLQSWIISHANQCPEITEEIQYLSCIARPSKIICVGLNYAKHAEESGMAAPKEPVLFFKSTTALCGPNDPVIIPKHSVKTDWEVELAVIIGKKATYVNESNAMEYVAGYCLHNDYSEREFQLERGGQWVKGKSCDSFAPMGPLLPGDVISTGTPAGVGLGQKPEPWYLKAGDKIHLGIEGLGEQHQTAIAHAD